MARSVWKGPFVEESLIKKVEKVKNDPNRKPIKTWSRKSTIIPDFVGFSFLIYNGKKFIPITGLGTEVVDLEYLFLKFMKCSVEQFLKLWFNAKNKKLNQ